MSPNRLTLRHVIIKMAKVKDKNTEQYKKDLHDPNNYNVVITHLEPDILECEVK